MHDDNHFPGDIRSLGIMGEFVCLPGIIGSKQITAIIMHESYFFFGKGGGNFARLSLIFRGGGVDV